MLKLISNLFLLFSIVVLTSCVEGDEEVWINDDASGNIVATYKLPTIALRQIGDPDDFIKALKLIETKMGTGITYSTDLINKLGKHLFGIKFKGVYSSDDTIPKGYVIVNVDKSNQPGSHWLAICDNLVYDSFGRKTSKLIPHLTLKNYRDAEYDAEQTARK